jgi:translocation and assembly module TamB
MSKHFRITLALIGILVALAVTAVTVMSTPWFRRALERRFVVALEDATGGRIEVREFRFYPLVLEAIFSGFVLHGSEAPEAFPLFSARTMVLRLNPAGLLRRKIRIMSLDWDGAELRLKTNPDGSTNVPGPLASYTAGQALEQLIELRIGRVVLAHTTFYWNDRALKVDASARDVALLLHFRRGRRYEGSLAASAVTTQGPQSSLPPVTFSTQFVLSKNELALTSVVWRARGMAGQGSFTFHPAPEPEGYFSFQTSADVAALKPLLPFPDLRNGTLRVEGQGIYRHEEISARGRFQTRHLLFQDAQFDSGPLDVSADYSLERSQMTISNLKVLGWGGSALGEGQVGLAGPVPQFHVSARLRDMNLASLLHSSKSQPPFAQLIHPFSLVDGKVELAWAGEFEKLNSKFDLHFLAPGAPPAGFLPLSGDAQGSFETNHGLSVRLEDSTLHIPHSLFRANGTMVESTGPGESPGRLQIQLETTRFEEWRPMVQTLFASSTGLPLSLESPATFVGEMTGSMSNPEVRGSLRLGKFEYRGWTWDGLQANISAAADSLQVSSGQLSHGTSVLNLEASAHLDDWRITQTSALRFSTHTQLTPLEGLKAALGINYPVGGRLSGQMSLAGTISNLEGTGSVRVRTGNFAGETFSSFSTSIRVSGSSWDLDTIELLKDQGRITGKVHIEPSNRSLTCQLQGTGFSLSDFNRLARAFPNSSIPHAVEGQASFNLQGNGTPEHFHFHSTALVQSISIGGSRVEDVHVQLDGEGQKVQIRGISSGPAGMFSFSGDTTAAGDWPLQLQGQYVSFRLDPWLRLFLAEMFNAQVTASGSFALNGPLRELSKLEMKSQMTTLEVSFPSLAWRNERPVEVRYASNRLSTQPFRMQGPSTNFVVDGSVQFATPPSLSWTIQGIADATILCLLDPNVIASGQSRINLNVSGSPARPQINGAVEVQDVGVEYRDLPFRLSNLNGEIQLEGERANLKSLRGISGGGAVTLDGFMTLALPPRVDLSVKLDQVRVRYPLDFTSILSGTLRLAGTSDRSQLRGDLNVSQVLASESKFWLDQMTQSTSGFESFASGAPSPLADSIRLNIRVLSPTPVNLQAQEMRLTADIDVRLQGSLANPVEVGAVHFLYGEAVFRGNRFTLDRGDLNLTNPIRTQAVLDLEAHTRVQQYDLTVDVSGPLGRLKMTYRSDPPLPTEDVISLLALGYARQQQASTSGLVSSFAAGNPTQAVGESALLSQALSSQVGGRIQRLFGVSRIQIDPNVGLPGLNNGERVTIEQQVTKDLTLTYITNTASSQYQIIQFEWAVGENVSIIGVRDPNGIVGVELRFRHRFK